MRDQKETRMKMGDLTLGAPSIEDQSEMNYLETDSDTDDPEMSYLETDPDTDDPENDNPWSQPIGLITWGLVLTTLTLNFLYLQYILPSIGFGLIFLGFQRIRRCNQWFQASWILAITKLLWHMAYLVILATPIHSLYTNNIVIKIAAIVFQFMQIILFRKAVNQVYQQADKKPNKDPLLSVIIWMLVTSIASFIPYMNLWIITIPLLLLYIIILISIRKIGEELNVAKELFLAAPVKMSPNVIMYSYLGLCLVLVLISCTFANHIRLQGTVQPMTTNLELREELVEKGFPDNIISDIADQDISMLTDAILIDSYQDTLSFDPIQVTNYNGNSYSTYNKPGKGNLEATTIYIEKPNDQVYVIEYFDWGDSKAYWQDGFTLSGEEGIELLNGVLQYQMNNTDFIASIPRLTCETITTNGWFGANTQRQISGAANYPFGSTRQRGYVFYRVQLQDDRWISVNFLTYIHNKHPFKFPYSKTEERLTSGNFMSNDNRKQHYTTFQMQAFRDSN